MKYLTDFVTELTVINHTNQRRQVRVAICGYAKYVAALCVACSHLAI